MTELSSQERRIRLIRFIEKHVAEMTKSKLAALPRRKPLNELGVDSLMAERLRAALQKELGRTLPTTIVFNYPSIEALAEHLSIRYHKPALVDEAPPSAPPSSRIIATLKGMSEPEARAYLASLRIAK